MTATTTQTVVVTSDTASTASSTTRKPRSFVMLSPRKAISSFIRRSPSSINEQTRRSASAPMDASPASPLRNVVSSDSGRPSVHVHPQRRTTLSFPAVADLFIKLRRMQTKAKNTRATVEEAGEVDSDSVSKGKQRVKPNHIETSSGEQLITHPVIVQECDGAAADGVEVVKRARLTIRDAFECTGGVDSVKLLRASRASLLEKAAMFQTNALVEEEWSCCIVCPKNRSGGHYRVQVCRYKSFLWSMSAHDIWFFRLSTPLPLHVSRPPSAILANRSLSTRRAMFPG